MRQPPKSMTYSAGLFFAGHYLLAGYGDPRQPDDQLQPPPLAAVVLSPVSTGSSSMVHGAIYSAVNAITDEHRGVGPVERPSTIAKST